MSIQESIQESIQDILRKLAASSAASFPRLAFVTMFTGVVVAPLILFAIGGRNPNTLGRHDLAWSCLVAALLLLVSISVGCLMFRREPQVTRGLSISPKYR